MWLLLLIIIIILSIFTIILIRAFSVKKIVPQETKKVELNKRDNKAIDILSGMIAFQTISTVDNIYMSDILGLDNYLRHNFLNIADVCEWNNINGAIYIKWSGKNIEAKPIVLMSHLDVVKSHGNWQKEPFGGQIEDGKIWGRGTVDTKSSLCSILYAIEELISTGYQPECDVMVFSSSREEIAGDDTIDFVSRLKQNNIIPKLVVDEGGAILDAPIDGINGRFAMIAMSERASAELIITANPDARESAQTKLSKFVLRANKLKLSKANFAPEVEAMFDALKPYMRFNLKMVMANLWFFKGIMLKILPILSKEAAAMILPNLTFKHPSDADTTGLSMGQSALSARIACTSHHNIQKCAQILLEFAEDNGLNAVIKTIRETPPPEKLNSDGYQLVVKTLSQVMPEVVSTPFILFGGTDARHFVGYADSVIRFAPIYLTNNQFASIHNIDENINIECIHNLIEFYQQLIKNS